MYKSVEKADRAIAQMQKWLKSFLSDVISGQSLILDSIIDQIQPSTRLQYVTSLQITASDLKIHIKPNMEPQKKNLELTWNRFVNNRNNTVPLKVEMGFFDIGNIAIDNVD